MTLLQYIVDLEQRATEAEAIHATAPVADVYRKVIGELRERGDTPIRSDTPDRLMSVAEAASRIAMSRRYIYTHKDQLPFVRHNGRTVRCSERALERWMAT